MYRIAGIRFLQGQDATRPAAAADIVVRQRSVHCPHDAVATIRRIDLRAQIGVAHAVDQTQRSLVQDQMVELEFPFGWLLIFLLERPVVLAVACALQVHARHVDAQFRHDQVLAQ